MAHIRMNVSARGDHEFNASIDDPFSLFGDAGVLTHESDESGTVITSEIK